MTTVPRELLEQVGVEVSPDTFQGLILEALRAMPRVTRGTSASTVTAAEIEALHEGGLKLVPVDLGADDPIARTAAAYATLIATSLTVPEAARRLGVDDSRIRQRLAARTLYGIKLRDGWRLPLWQFDGNGLLPGVARVISRLDTELHPLTVQDWMLTPTPDFADDHHDAMSPRDWLRTGHDPEEVAALAAELSRAI